MLVVREAQKERFGSAVWVANQRAMSGQFVHYRGICVTASQV